MSGSPRYPQRVRNDLRFRELTVLCVERISAGFRRVVLGGETLNGFTSRDSGDHSRLPFPQPDAHFAPPTVTEEGIVWLEGPRPPSRDCTPLCDELRHELATDFFIHEGGVTSSWAMQTQSDGKLTATGPRGSLVMPEGYAHQPYVCDESGMPVLRCHLEMLSKLVVKPQVSALVSVWDDACQDYLAHLDGFNIEWLAHDEQAVNTRLAQMQIPADDYFIRITGEGKIVKNLGRRFEAERYDPQRVHTTAYWRAK